MELPDIQKIKDTRGICIDKAGICNLQVPVSISMKNSENLCHTVATVQATVNVHSEVKGINMSRLPIFIQNNRNLTLSLIQEYAYQICDICETDNCELIYKFPYFLTKKAPVSLIEGIVQYDSYFRINKINDEITRSIGITAIASTCCPCSKEISDYNAHNQKCYISIDCNVIQEDILWLEDLINYAESSASWPSYSVLKRPDEKFVTEKMYEHPQFVEDVVRDCYASLIHCDKILDFKVTAIADESIHMHKAYASIATPGWNC